jgi:hypothetical protein
MPRNRLRLSIHVLPDTRPDQYRPGQRDDTSHGVNDARAGEIDRAMAQSPVEARLREPAASPDPVRVDAVGQGDPEAEKAEVLPAPALGHRSRGDRRRRVHEDHHEKEERHHAHVVHPAQAEALRAEKTVFEGSRGITRGVDGGTDADSSIQNRRSRAERRVPTRRHRSVEPVAPAERPAIGPERDAPQRVDHEVHGHRVARVLRATQAGLHEREARLHEHDQEPRDEDPHHVDREQVVRDAIVEVSRGHLARRGISLSIACGCSPHSGGAAGRIGPRRFLRVIGSREIPGQRFRRGRGRRRRRRSCGSLRLLRVLGQRGVCQPTLEADRQQDDCVYFFHLHSYLDGKGPSSNDQQFCASRRRLRRAKSNPCTRGFWALPVRTHTCRPWAGEDCTKAILSREERSSKEAASLPKHCRFPVARLPRHTDRRAQTSAQCYVHVLRVKR